MIEKHFETSVVFSVCAVCSLLCAGAVMTHTTQTPLLRYDVLQKTRSYRARKQSITPTSRGSSVLYCMVIVMAKSAVVKIFYSEAEKQKSVAASKKQTGGQSDAAKKSKAKPGAKSPKAKVVKSAARPIKKIIIPKIIQPKKVSPS